jgi:hypothetical protein
LNDKTIFEKQLENSIIEKKISVTKRQLGHPTFKKKLILRIYGNATKSKKNEVEKLRKNSPRNLRICQ